MNPYKFQFAKKSVYFAGFRVSESSIEPLPKYLDAIRDFPSPTSTTDIRSWCGLVNQIVNYAQLHSVMAIFKPFLSPHCKFSWSHELEEAFQQSKEAIISAIREGVEIFYTHKRTYLRPDWSTRGIGYFLLQQHCSINFVRVSTIYNHVCRNDLNRSDLNKKETQTEFTNKKNPIKQTKEHTDMMYLSMLN